MVDWEGGYCLRLAFQARKGDVGGLEGHGPPLRLAFRAREGWWCIGMVYWKGETPSVSRFERGRGMWVGWKKTSPPSRFLSDGEGCGWVERTQAPSVSRFERGRGVGVSSPSISCFERGVCRKRPLRLARNAREGNGGLGGRNPPPPHFSSEGGVVMGCWKETTPPSRSKREGGAWGLVEGGGPLRLVFRARKGDVGGLGGRKTPLPRFSSEGGVMVGCWKETTPSVSKREGGVMGVGSQETAPSVSLKTRGRGMGVGLKDTRPRRLAFRARKGWGTVKTDSL